MGKVFLAFPGWQVRIKNRIKKLEQFDFWNLDTISEDEFIKLIQKKIKPINKNVINNYYHKGLQNDFSIAYKNSNWGILLPDSKNDYFGSKHRGSLLLSLFSGIPLPVMFSVGHDGVSIEKKTITDLEKSAFHSEDKIFKNKKFTSLYKKLFPSIENLYWSANEVNKWGREEWRRYVAFMQFEELFQYFGSKNIMTWQSECADIVSLYEILLSRRKDDNGKYKIIQRIEVLLREYYGKKINTVISELRQLYSFRNEYVHGGYFDRLKRSTKTDPASGMALMPNVDYDFLERQSKVARQVFIVFLYLKERYKTELSVPEIIQEGIMNVKTRKKIQKYSKEILDCVI